MLSNDKLRFLRQHYGLRQIDIADYTGKSIKWIKMIERGDVDPSQEIHDKWLECCRNQVRTTKRAKDFN